MLDEKTLEWLERRKNLCTRCYKKNWCRAGAKHNFNTTNCRYFEMTAPWSITGNLLEDYHDAAEFESRVAAKTARFFDIETCRMCDYRKDGCDKVKDRNGKRIRMPNEWCVLKRTRLAVEREMIAEGKGHGKQEKENGN